MTYRDELRGVTFVADRLYGALLVIAAMVGLYWYLHGPNVPDWVGYSDIYDRDGAWLVQQGRDPLFVALVRGGRSVFGGNGYDLFRTCIFGVFVAVAARTVYAMPSGRTWAIFLALIVVSAFLLKSLAQIREGLAFLMVLWPLVRTFRLGKSNPIEVGVWALAAPFMHSGATVFTILWGIAIGLASIRRRLPLRLLPWLMLGGAVLFGLAVAAVVTTFASTLEFSLRDLGIDTEVEAVGGAWKYTYWIAMGGICSVLGHQLYKSSKEMVGFGSEFSMTLGLFIIPLIYVICVIFVFRQFYLPSITSMSIRLLLTSISLSILILSLRGRVNFMLIGIGSFVLVDQFRLLVQNPLV